MDTKAFEYFVALYRLQNMHKAAEQLFISQQGLSRVIQNLEKEWEVQLFERSKYGMYPTKAGDFFYHAAVKMQSELDYLKQELRNISDGREELRLACSYGTLHILYPFIQKFREKYPDIEVKWGEYMDVEAERALVRRDVDAAFTIVNEGQEDFINIPMFSRKHTLLVYEGHPFWGKKSLGIADLKEERILIEGEGFHVFSIFQKRCLDAGFYPNIVARTAEINLCYNLCRLKEGLAVSVDFITDLYGGEDLQAIPFVDCDFTWNVQLSVHRNEKWKRCVKLFVEFMEQKVKL